METKEANRNKGITLIALVVTIVVLLILAGISINMIIGQGGIIAKTKDAKEENRGATVEDARDLWRSDMIIAQEGDLEVSQSLDSLLEDLQAKGLLTDNDVYQIESTGSVKIGSHNIDFSLNGTSTKVDWSKLEPGLYETGTDKLIKSWDDLVADNEIAEYWVNRFNIKEKGDLVISRNVRSIYDDSDGCGIINSTITGIFIPKETKIDARACLYCRGLKRVVLEDGITEIGARAFVGKTELEEIIIPQSVEKIGASALSGTAWYSNKPDGVIYAGKVLYSYKGTMPENTTIEIKDGTKSITANAFSDNDGKENLVKVVIPNSVNSIGDSAFYNCTNLSNIEGGNGITELGKQTVDGTAWYNNQSDGVIYWGNALYGYKGTMPSGTEITVKDGIGAIAGEAFKDCTGVANITLPDTVETIGEYAFSNTGVTSIELGNSLRTIGEYAFYKSTNLENVEMQDNVEEIGAGTFSGCTKLTSVRLSKKLTKISNVIFQNCESLKSITIPENVMQFETTVMGRSYAFAGCTGLESITIPKEIHYLPGELFKDCTNLKTVNFRGTKEEWENISIGSNNDPLTSAEKVYNYTGE